MPKSYKSSRSWLPLALFFAIAGCDSDSEGGAESTSGGRGGTSGGTSGGSGGVQSGKGGNGGAASKGGSTGAAGDTTSGAGAGGSADSAGAGGNTESGGAAGGGEGGSAGSGVCDPATTGFWRFGDGNLFMAVGEGCMITNFCSIEEGIHTEGTLSDEQMNLDSVGGQPLSFDYILVGDILIMIDGFQNVDLPFTRFAGPLPAECPAP